MTSRSVSALGLAVALLLCSTACHRGPPTLALADGCYYAGATPVVKIAGKRGTSWSAAFTTTSPSPPATTA